MMAESKNTSSGIGVLGLLGVLFVGLKLTGIIDWSWWWVTVPFWGGLALIVAILLILAASVLIADILDRLAR